MMQQMLFDMVTKGILLIEIGLPFIFWGLEKEKNTSFAEWMGFIRPQRESRWRICLVFAAVYYLHATLDLTKFYDGEILSALGFMGNDDSLIAYQMMTQNRVDAAIRFLTFFISNFMIYGLAVEFFYRGFLCRRLCDRFGKMKGIAFHALVYGLIQSIQYFVMGVPALRIELMFYMAVLVFPSFAVGGFLLGYLNEKIFNGSILPSVLLQAAGLLLTAVRMLFGGGGI